VSKYINVNPDHYKLRGRERPGKGIVPKEHPKTTEPTERKRWKERQRKSDVRSLKSDEVRSSKSEV
jgi:hypothetical protein